MGRSRIGVGQNRGQVPEFVLDPFLGGPRHLGLACLPQTVELGGQLRPLCPPLGQTSLNFRICLTVFNMVHQPSDPLLHVCQGFFDGTQVRRSTCFLLFPGLRHRVQHGLRPTRVTSNALADLIEYFPLGQVAAQLRLAGTGARRPAGAVVVLSPRCHQYRRYPRTPST